MITIDECIAWAEDVEVMNPQHHLYQECRDATIAHLQRLKAIDKAPDPLSEALNSSDGVYRP